MNIPFNVNQYFLLMREINDIPVAPEWEANVKAHLQNAAKMAEIIANAPIDENTIDISNVFRPGKRDV